ncbi:uncharacterized protein Z518_00382 [Rhinocladiella mackenziei CBS 650.93]|uniref:Uncharacterized protein n=1 Tax=Rhinocladiella mackenziei CBS 650.93 TaxID=1442369 RepID=A0A0D2HF24_9EURO|nr:uncharacterized protein Z518_00382 [Rhinocladiella mackenziei CBS 650.93]KIX09303.1 hypothetical protein Z518_00382 [Rhinocladiella mackenziei CBS 650.93]
MTEIDCDVLIYGGTPGAAGTAVESAKLGHKVLLVPSDEHIGGVQVNGLGAMDIDRQAGFQNSPSVGDAGLELRRRTSAIYGRLETVVKKDIKDPSVWQFESRVAESNIKDWLAESPNIQIIKASLARGKTVDKSDVKVTKVFIDATCEGDLLAATGISTTYGREASSVYGESLTRVRHETIYSQIQVPVDPYRTPGDPSSGLLYGISDEPFGTPRQGDNHLMAFSFQLPLTDNKDNQLPIYKPEGYDPSHYELYRRHAQAGGRLSTPIVRIPGRKADVDGCESPLHLDLLSFHEEWQRFGYPLDELPDNNHFPRMLYICDARRMVSDYVIRQGMAVQGVPYDILKEKLLVRGALFDASKVGVPSFPDDEKVLN